MNTGRMWHVVAVAGLTLVSAWADRARGDYVFGTPQKLSPLVNSPATEYDPALSADGLELYFQSSRGDGYGDSDLYVAKRATVNDAWQAAENLGPIVNTPAAESGPSLSADGLTLYFNSNRPGGYGGHDLYLTTRESRQGPWSKPVNLGPVVNSEVSEINPNISSDGLSLYFADVEGDSVPVRPGGAGSTDIWMSTRASLAAPWGPPVNLGAPVNTGATDGSPEISSDGRVLFLNRWLGDSSPFFDIWVAIRKSPQAPWGDPKNLGAPVNTSAWDGNAELSADGRTLYFVSTRGNSDGSTDIWEVPIVPIVDFNGDGRVEQADVRILLDHWGTNYALCDIGPTPFGDGVVDMQDLAVLTQYASDNVADPTLLSCWKFDETEGPVACDCAGTCSGKLVGSPKWRPNAGAVGGALELDGVHDYVSAPILRDPTQSPFSIFAWVQGGKPGQVILSQEKGADWLVAGPASGALATDLRSGGRFSSSLSSKTVITDGQWHRVGLVWDGSQRTLYVDDVAVAEDTQNGFKTTTGALRLGAGKTLAAGTFWSGLIDEVRIYDRVIKP